MKIFKLSALALLTASFAVADPGKSVVRVNTTIQNFSAAQPWEKTAPRSRRALGAVLPNNQVLTTAKMAADAIYLELQSADSSRNIPAKVIAIDYEANLALLAPQDDPGFMSELVPAALGPVNLQGDELDVIQLENKGTTQITSGKIRGLELLSSFLSGRYFLSYEMPGAIRTEGNSYTLPVFREDELAGILTSYDSKEQLSDIISIDIIRAFLADAADGSYEGFPSLGAGYSSTEDPNFRSWLQLPEDQGGLYISKILPGGSAEESGIRENDVLLSIAGHEIDRKGYYQHPQYGPLFWTHLVRGAHPVGEKVPARLLRDGKEVTLLLKLRRSAARLIPHHLHDRAPTFLIKGGLVFQELTLPYLKAFGKEWRSRAPLNLLDAYNRPETLEKGRRRIVVLTRVIPSQATIGYDRISNHIVNVVNGRKIKDLADLEKALAQTPADGLHEIKTDESPYQIYLDQNLADRVDQQLRANGLSTLSRIELEEE